jgi:hypothetical protein
MSATKRFTNATGAPIADNANIARYGFEDRGRASRIALAVLRSDVLKPSVNRL